jgi:3-deoxy-manno-octulosonate cytidylyltransferase (CMP-KDO synthetase)
MLERGEKLEQLRVLYYGYSIHTQLAAEVPGPGVDNDEDLQRVTELIRNRT